MIAKPLDWVPSPMTNDIGERSTRYGASPMTNVFYWIFEGSRGFVLQGRGTFPTLAAAQEAAQMEWNGRVAAVVDETSKLSGIELAARFVEKRLHDYVSEHGSTDPDTGTVGYPGNGEEYVYELEEIAEGIRALATPTASKGVADE